MRMAKVGRCLCLMAFFLLACEASGWSATRNVTCSGTITSALQTAINSSIDGDVVNISSGVCSAGTVTWENKNITVQGQGIGVTAISGLNVQVNTKQTNKAAWRISGISFGAGQIRLNPTGGNSYPTVTSGWRIDHCEFSYPGCTQNIAVYITGTTWGLIDNCSFSGAGNAIFYAGFMNYYNEYQSTNPGMGGYSWSLPLHQGSVEAVYIEDCTFSMPSGCYYGVGDSYYGGRTVFRHNKVTNAYWQNHACRGGERGGNINAEIYNNDFNATDSAWYRAVHLRSGTAVVFNNTIRGYFTTMNVDNQRSDGANTSTPYGACDGSKPWDGNQSKGWPCLDQIGRGSGVAFGQSQPSVPVYVWNNGSDTGCSTGGTCSNNRTMTNQTTDSAVQAGRDYINNGKTPKPGYVPFTYPHPLQGGTVADSSLSAPSNLRISQ